MFVQMIIHVDETRSRDTNPIFPFLSSQSSFIPFVPQPSVFSVSKLISFLCINNPSHSDKILRVRGLPHVILCLPNHVYRDNFNHPRGLIDSISLMSRFPQSSSPNVHKLITAVLIVHSTASTLGLEHDLHSLRTVPLVTRPSRLPSRSQYHSDN
ncbi:hypothetical protein K504DRAFT_163749 [Pleomassaria siparia CBS 279.74]|uniref:Uncharacterized protein n=1 Tax=Pleomassaria siparia CBS 279.74 TaxID=1314801 RepID=A0A6G1JVS6_9PLEO|nr:hypothetical protein K504DRAFT_163749 [Pleomassaria siparia CBS 279.74]